MKVEIITTGTVPGYEDYHADIVVYGNKVGESHYDKRQRKYIAQVNKKRIYRDNLTAIKKAVELVFNNVKE